MLNMAMVVITATLVIFLMCSSSSEAILQKRLQLPSPLTGPESLAFDLTGGGPYVGSSDGRIFKYIGQDEGFIEYASTSRNRDKTLCDGLADFSELQATCGRPLGLGFNQQTGDLYVADAYFGLVKVAPGGENVTHIFGSENAYATRFTDGLDVDPETGIVYFTEASTNFRFKDFETLIDSEDKSGSLLKYDPSTDQTTVLLGNLAMPSGVAVSSDGSFVLVGEYLANRIQRVWLKGPNAFSSELFMPLAGSPNNIKRNSRDQFWISVNGIFRSPIFQRNINFPTGVKVSENRIILQIVSLISEYGTESASEIQDYNGTLYSGSLQASYATIFTTLL
ncbi:protein STRICTOSIDINE SYNTHASE-LIKE 12-like [Trifolium pratense]|uniref:Uncharacterized protein n=2 Tax=Trifolium pratense TaxID=57577 RepID=A0ACB0ISW3_TRIPR|nr:protein STRICTOSIDINE SYNTHASE-LIKE 12-like [Trifolium pratense]CAJ2634950.1 unnamed protein product [Trifolium pratense]CAJ2634963.1 unnamed protein product [Trifolium pratense]